LLFFTDNEMATAEKERVIREIQANAGVLEEARKSHAIAEQEGEFECIFIIPMVYTSAFSHLFSQRHNARI